MVIRIFSCFLVIMNNAAVQTHIQVFVWMCDLFSFGYIISSTTACPLISCPETMPNFLALIGFNSFVRLFYSHDNDICS